MTPRYDHQTVLAKLKAVWLPYLTTTPRRFMPSRLHALAELLALEENWRVREVTWHWTINSIRNRKPLPLPYPWGNLPCIRTGSPMPTLSAGGAMGRGTKRAGDRRRTGVIHCLLAGGRQSLSPCAVATKLARSLQIGRASNGGLPKRDVNTVSEPDSQIPPDSEGNDEKTLAT